MNYYMTTSVKFKSILGEPVDRIVPQEDKTGKWVYTYNKPRMSLFDKDVTEIVYCKTI